jgi:hypothetical protein
VLVAPLVKLQLLKRPDAACTPLCVFAYDSNSPVFLQFFVVPVPLHGVDFQQPLQLRALTVQAPVTFVLLLSTSFLVQLWRAEPCGQLRLQQCVSPSQVVPALSILPRVFELPICVALPQRYAFVRALRL